MNSISAMLIAIGISVSGFFLSNGISQLKALDRVVEVRGFDERTVDSDVARWNVEFSVGANQLAEVHKMAFDVEKKVKNYLISKGFKEEDIWVSVLKASEKSYEYDYQSRKREKPQFKYSGKLTVGVGSKNVDLVEKAYKSSDSLISQGINLDSNVIEFEYTKLNGIKPDMLKAANTSARIAAESLTGDIGGKVGGIKNASQGLFDVDSVGNNGRFKKVRVVTNVSFYLR